MKLLVTVLVLIFSLPSMAAINPIYRCSERGYQIIDDRCVFPDNTSCPIDDFADGKCGEEFTKTCVPEGRNVWQSVDRCCEGLVPYLPGGVAGQTTCESVLTSVPLGTALLNPISILVLALIGYLLIGRAKKIRRGN